MKNIEKARANCDIMNGRSGATLIVVPPGLVRQVCPSSSVSFVVIAKFSNNCLIISFLPIRLLSLTVGRRTAKVYKGQVKIYYD